MGKVERLAWKYSRVIVSKGVTIGAGSIAAAGSIVTQDVPTNVVVARLPARKVGDISPAKSGL